MYEELKQLINDNIKANGSGEITGTTSNEVLNAMVAALGEGKAYGGLANGDEAPEKDERFFYFRTKKGANVWGESYLNIEQDGIYVVYWKKDESQWFVVELFKDYMAVVLMSREEFDNKALSDYNFGLLSDVNKMRVIIGGETNVDFRKKRMFYYSYTVGGYYFFVSPPELSSNTFNFYELTLSGTREENGYPYTVQKISVPFVIE